MFRFEHEFGKFRDLIVAESLCVPSFCKDFAGDLISYVVVVAGFKAKYSSTSEVAFLPGARLKVLVI